MHSYENDMADWCRLKAYLVLAKYARVQPPTVTTAATTKLLPTVELFAHFTLYLCSILMCVRQLQFYVALYFTVSYMCLLVYDSQY